MPMELDPIGETRKLEALRRGSISGPYGSVRAVKFCLGLTCLFLAVCSYNSHSGKRLQCGNDNYNDYCGIRGSIYSYR